MIDRTEYVLTLRLFMSNKRGIPIELLSEMREAAQRIAGSCDFSADFESHRGGLFRRRRSRWEKKISQDLWGEICERTQDGSLSYVRLASPGRTVNDYNVNVDCRLIFDAQRNALIAIDLRKEPFVAARSDAVLTLFRSVALDLINAAGDLVIYGYCDVGEYGLSRKATLQVGGESIPVFSTRRSRDASSSYPDVNLDSERDVLSRVNDGAGIKGVYWLTFVRPPYSTLLQSIQGVRWTSMPDNAGFLELPGYPSAVDTAIRDSALSVISGVR